MQSTKVSQPNVKTLSHNTKTEKKIKMVNQDGKHELFIRNNMASELNIKDAAVVNKKTLYY